MYPQVFSIANSIALNNAPSIGALLGTTGSHELLNSLNQGSSLGTIFAQNPQDSFTQHYNQYMQHFITPLRAAEKLISATAAVILRDDQYIPRTTVDELKYVPQIMQMPILMMPEVRTLMGQGRVEGYGYDLNQIPEDDFYGRICETNGLAVSTDDSKYIESVWYSTDPDMSIDDMDAVADTRTFVRYVIEAMKLDPTNLEELGELKD
jgi:hypothetical protein